MSHTLTRAELQRLRLLTQRLAAPNGGTPSTLVAAMGAIQSQERAASILAIRPRVRAVNVHDVEHALQSSRRLLRTWCLRGTLHLVASDDLGWILETVAPRLLRNSRRRYRQLELDDHTLTRATDLLCRALREHGALTRAELGAYLEQNEVSAEGQRLPHLLRRAALLGLICLGQDRDRTETYVLLEDWLDPLPAPSAAGWERLARRYLSSYGPASVDDFATWCGAYKRQARAAFDAHARSLLEVEVEGKTLWLLEEQAALLLDSREPAVPTIQLLPAYDPLLLGYQSRDWMVQSRYAREIHPGGGFLRPTLLIDGEAGGTWKIARSDPFLEVIVTPFTALRPEHKSLLEAEVDDLARFLGVQAALQIA